MKAERFHIPCRRILLKKGPRWTGRYLRVRVGRSGRIGKAFGDDELLVPAGRAPTGLQPVAVCAEDTVENLLHGTNFGGRVLAHLREQCRDYDSFGVFERGQFHLV
jgi:hypothetical protein